MFFFSTTETENPTLNLTHDDLSTASSITSTTTSHRPSTKQIRSQVSAPTTTANSEPRVVPSKNSNNRGTRGQFFLSIFLFDVSFILVGRTRSEDRFRGSSVSLGHPSLDHPIHTNLPSYAAHTSSSMNKLRDQTSTSSTPTSSSSNTQPLSATTTCVPSSHPTVRTPTNTIPSHTRSSSSSRKNIPKSCSTQNLVLHPPITTNHSNSASKVPPNTLRSKLGNLSRRPPNLPIATHNSHSTSTSTSSSSTASSNFSSPTKFLPTEEHPPSICIDTSTVPLRPLDNTNDDLMPKWAQDCFYRTVILGLKPLHLQDSPSSPIKIIQTSMSTCSIESSDSLDIHNELQACPVQRSALDVQVRRSVSIPDYRPLKPLSQTSPKESNNDRDEYMNKLNSMILNDITSILFSDSIQDDHRFPIIEQLVNNLSQPLEELEQLYSTVSEHFTCTNHIVFFLSSDFTKFQST